MYCITTIYAVPKLKHGVITQKQIIKHADHVPSNERKNTL